MAAGAAEASSDGDVCRPSELNHVVVLQGLLVDLNFIHENPVRRPLCSRVRPLQASKRANRERQDDKDDEQTLIVVVRGENRGNTTSVFILFPVRYEEAHFYVPVVVRGRNGVGLRPNPSTGLTSGTPKTAPPSAPTIQQYVQKVYTRPPLKTHIDYMKRLGKWRQPVCECFAPGLEGCTCRVPAFLSCARPPRAFGRWTWLGSRPGRPCTSWSSARASSFRLLLSKRNSNVLFKKHKCTTPRMAGSSHQWFCGKK